MADSVHLVVLANDSSAFGIPYSVAHADNLDYHFANEEKFDDFRGLKIQSVVFVGTVSKENAEKFKTLVSD